MIRIRDLHKSFGNNHVLRGVNLDIVEGETTTIIGGSGEGKTVLLRTIMGLMQPDKGSVEIDGINIARLNEHRLAKIQRRFGMLFQGAALFDSMTVGENIAFGLHHLTELSEEKIKAKVSEKLKMVGLEGIEKARTDALSGGMKKRVSLARAIAMDPEYILYDEPSTGLDPIMADVINDLVIHLQEEMKITSIAVTHDMVSAYKISNRIAMLYEGKIEEIGTPHEIGMTKNPVVKQFVTGSSKGPIQRGVLFVRERNKI